MDHVDEGWRRWWRVPRRVAVAGVIIAAAAAVFTSATVLGPTASAGTTEPATIERFDGEELVNGLIFGLGPAARAHPDLVLTPVADTAANHRVLQQVYAEVERKHPGALDRFAAAMYSGDRLRISDAAVTTVGLLQETFLAIVPPEPGELGDGVWVIQYAVVAVVAVAVQVIFWFKDPSAPDRMSLEFERWVDNIASTLS